MAAIPIARVETCSLCGSTGGQWHYCGAPKGRKAPLVVLPKVAPRTEKSIRIMTALYVGSFMAFLATIQVATDPAAPWNLIAPGTSAAAIIVFAWMASRSKEKSDTLFAQTLSDNSKQMVDAMREVRESVRELASKINNKE